MPPGAVGMRVFRAGCEYLLFQGGWSGGVPGAPLRATHRQPRWVWRVRLLSWCLASAWEVVEVGGVREGERW